MEKTETKGTAGPHGEDFVVRLAPGVEVGKTEEGLARIRIPRPRSGFQRFLSFIFGLRDHKILVLDETGTAVLSLINGRRKFSDLVASLAEMHPMDPLLARRSMEAFLYKLTTDGVVERP